MAWLLRSAALLLRVLGYLLTPFLILFNRHKRETIPPIKNDLLKLSVVELAEKIRQKEVNITEFVLCVPSASLVTIKCVNCKCRNIYRKF